MGALGPPTKGTKLEHVILMLFNKEKARHFGDLKSIGPFGSSRTKL